MNNQLIEIRLPKLGESITEATLLEWQVAPGEQVRKGQLILEVATDKVNAEVVAPSNGRILELHVEADQVAKVGALLGVMEAGVSDGLPDEHVKPVQDHPEKEPQEAEDIPGKKIGQASLQQREITRIQARDREGKGSRFYSPLVDKIAQAHHISYPELARIPTSGKDGRLRKSDVFNYLEAGRPAQFVQPPPSTGEGRFQLPDLKFDKGKGKIIKMDRMRQLIADHMVFSKYTAPHVTAYVEADVTGMVQWRKAHKDQFEKKYGQKLTFTPLFIAAVTQALVEFPRINSSLDGRNIIEKEEINIGVATALPDGNLIVPVVKNTKGKSLAELAKAVNELAEKARNHQLKGDDTKNGTFTISNVGTFGSLMGTPIINQPEAAILATGAIKKRAEVRTYGEEDKIEIRQMMYLSLSFDHRIVDGFLAGSFLKRVADYFEDYQG